MTSRVELEWLTVSESGSSRFVVERSHDAQAWMDLLEVPAAGASQGPRLYKATDTTPLHGVSYYRIRMEDLDSSHAHSPVRGVELRRAPAVMPNPAKGAFTVFGLADGAQLELHDALGRQVRVACTEGPGTGSATVDAHAARQGVYILRVTEGGITTSIRVLIEH